MEPDKGGSGGSAENVGLGWEQKWCFLNLSVGQSRLRMGQSAKELALDAGKAR